VPTRLPGARPAFYRLGAWVTAVQTEQCDSGLRSWFAYRSARCSSCRRASYDGVPSPGLYRPALGRGDRSAGGWRRGPRPARALFFCRRFAGGMIAGRCSCCAQQQLHPGQAQGWWPAQLAPDRGPSAPGQRRVVRFRPWIGRCCAAAERSRALARLSCLARNQLARDLLAQLRFGAGDQRPEVWRGVATPPTQWSEHGQGR